jgi:hypothetical protein
MHSCAAGGYDCQYASVLPQEVYEDNFVANNAVELLKNKPTGKPWFLQISFPGPHPPFVVTASMMARTAGATYPTAVDNSAMSYAVQQTVRRDYAAELENLDAMFARVLAAIPADELASTYIIIASDHGEMLGDHDDWGKVMPWQGSVSVPLVVAGPGLPSNATVGEPVATLDIAGTILDLAVVEKAPKMTTVSLMPFLGGNGTYRSFVSSGLSGWRAVVMTRPDGSRLKLVCCVGKCVGQPRNDSSVFVGDDGGEDSRSYAAVLNGQRVHKHVPDRGSASNTVLLFDIDADEFDMDNLAPSRPKSVKDMLALLPSGWCA